MNKIVVTATLLLVFTNIFCGTTAAMSPGSAPNSGDGIPDGSGFETSTFPVEIVTILVTLVILVISLLLMFFLFKRQKKKP